MSKDTLSQVAGFFKNKKEASAATNKQQYDEYLLTLRNDNTNADEAAIWIKGILYVLTAFVSFLGYNYYLATFSEMFDPLMATAFAIALPVVVEIGKIQLVKKGFRSISLGWINDGIPKTLYWSCVLIIGGGCFWWSYTISTGGIKEVAKQNAEIKNRQDTLSNTISAATLDIDVQIAALQQSNTDAGSLKTKRGKTNWGAQPILEANAKSLASLQEQRKATVDQVTAEYNARAGETKTKVSGWASFIERFGGWGEVGCLFCLIALAVFERVLRDQNLADHQKSQAATSPPHQNGQPQSNGQRSFVQNEGNRIGFYWQGYGNAPTDVLTPQHLFQSDQKTVAQSPQTVPQSEQGKYADSVLEMCRQAIQKDIANFDNMQARNATVARRIHAALDTCYITIMNGDFAPSYLVGCRLYNYLQETVWPRLNGVGHPYTNQTFFTERLYHAFKPQEQPTR